MIERRTQSHSPALRVAEQRDRLAEICQQLGHRPDRRGEGGRQVCRPSVTREIGSQYPATEQRRRLGEHRPGLRESVQSGQQRTAAEASHVETVIHRAVL